eukprot:768415-Hanusia_phi.AAC.1
MTYSSAIDQILEPVHQVRTKICDWSQEEGRQSTKRRRRGRGGGEGEEGKEKKRRGGEGRNERRAHGDLSFLSRMRSCTTTKSRIATACEVEVSIFMAQPGTESHAPPA